ncbi:MAG TPA: HlyD family efflux transporter periplasmic adaptor subunit [Tepidisphaeraceae bacterium]|nr:HlyD family efflux transporter periplasmic adaptor subunit [Tepidisphaeraceae bacterium]
MANEVIESQSQKGQEDAHQAGSRSKLVQRLLTAGSNLPAFVTDLVTAQAVTVAGTEAAGFMLEKSSDDVLLRPIAHVRPDNSNAETRTAAIQAFQDIIKPCIDQGKDGAIEINAADGTSMEPQFCLVTLLRADGEIVAASAVITRCMNLERARQRLMSMQLVAGYFELFSLRRNSEQARVIAQSHQHVLQLATAVAVAEGFEAAARNLCNELANRSGAVRVALGWLKGRTIKVKALSHTEQFDKKQELVVQLQNAMEECLDQEEVVLYDPTGASSTPNVARAAQIVSRAQGGNIVLSLPLRKGEEIVGVTTLEFPANQPLGPNVASGLAVAVDLLAPQLQDRYVNDRWLITKAGISTRELGEKAIGKKYMITKLIVVASIALLLFVTFYEPMYRVSAPFRFTAVEKASLSAPFEGFLGAVHAKPGEKVVKGQKLFELKTEELRLKQLDAEKRALSAMRTADKHRADRTRIADYKIAMADHDAAKAEADLLAWQVAQATVVAPMDGEVLKGDLADKVGSPVKREDVLMEVGPIDNLKVELAVNERDIQFINQTQTGEIATNALPSEGYAIKIERIVPMSTPKESSNVFTVYATADTVSPSWRPGAEGEARINIEKKPLIWIWTHRLVEFMQLKLWM